MPPPVSDMMGGRFTKVDLTGEMPGMGAFVGFGIYGYDNVEGTFVATWVDNQSTGIMDGTGTLAADGTTMTWTFTQTCPLTKGPTKIREVERRTGPDAMTVEMFGADPKSGKEYRMMRMEFTRGGNTTEAVLNSICLRSCRICLVV